MLGSCLCGQITPHGAFERNVNPKLPPELAIYTVLPHLGHYEFIPLKYEIVTTNTAGLFRCRLGQWRSQDLMFMGA
ncbi:hypothetical protein K1719_018969 [Acacia pycnantha]|nr:hypothetical protein K1719_018969 [Acacia pycnantha]